MKKVMENIKARYPQKVVTVHVQNIEKYDDLSDLNAFKNMDTLSLLLYALGDSESALKFAEHVSALDLPLYRRIKGFTDSAAASSTYKGNSLSLCTVIYR